MLMIMYDATITIDVAKLCYQKLIKSTLISTFKITMTQVK